MTDEPKNHIYETDQPDVRVDPNLDAANRPSRFRPRYRKLHPDEIELHDQIKSQADTLFDLFTKCGTGRYRSLAYTELEMAVMWAVKELTS